MSELSRRSFLQGAAALGLAGPGTAIGLRGARPEESQQRSLVFVFLRGGADFLNMVIPLDDDFYALKRPGIGISPDEIVPLDSHWGLHPALGALAPLYAAEEFLPIVNAGSPHRTRSHFDAQDFMCFGAPGMRTVHDGWLNRYLEATRGAQQEEFRAVGMQRLLPTSLRGSYPVLAVPDAFIDKRSKEVLGLFDEFYGADGMEDEREGDGSMEGEREDGGDVDVVESGRVTIETLRRYREIVSRPDPAAVDYPRSSFAGALQNLARVIRAGEGLEVAGIDLNGWDHHANQGASGGVHARLQRDLAHSLVAFRRHLGEAFERTLIVVVTEFGRTVLENGSGGTDHGHGGGIFLLGGGLRGGKVHGDWVGLRSERLYQGRDLPVTTDFRDVFATVLAEHLDFKAPKGFFPDYRPKKLRLFS